MRKSPKEEFHFLLIKTRKILTSMKNIDINKTLKNLSKNDSIESFYNENLSCSTEKFITDYRVPLTLQQLCLKFLHQTLALKIKNKKYHKQLSFIDQPRIIANLPIPLTLKNQLLFLFCSCARHCQLMKFYTEHFRQIKRYIIRPNSELYVRLIKNKEFPNKDLYLVYKIPDLTNKILKLSDFSLIESPNFQFACKYVISNCDTFQCIDYS